MNAQLVDYDDIRSLNIILRPNKEYEIHKLFGDINFRCDLGVNYIILSWKRRISHEEILIKTFDSYKKLEDCRTVEDFYSYMKWIDIGLYLNETLYANEIKLYELDFLKLLETNQDFYLTCHSNSFRVRADIIKINEEICKWLNKNIQGYLIDVANEFDQPTIHFTYRPSSSLLRKL